jgi:hypothetical protein
METGFSGLRPPPANKINNLDRTKGLERGLFHVAACCKMASWNFNDLRVIPSNIGGSTRHETRHGRFAPALWETHVPECILLTLPPIYVIKCS